MVEERERKKLEEINEIGLRLVSQCREALSLPFEEQVRLDDQALTGERERDGESERERVKERERKRDRERERGKKH